MNKKQLGRWYQLSIGLARHSYPEITEARRNKVETAVKNFILNMESWHELNDIRSWDGHPGKVYICDEMSNYLFDNRWEFDGKHGTRDTRFGTMVACCVRAGFDIAVEPSAGVLGFNVGDLRKIFPRKLPKWVQEFFAEPIDVSVPDTEGVWL
ncbi:TPA: hypothetical protein ACYLN4_000512 [Burkholderia lata]